MCAVDRPRLGKSHLAASKGLRDTIRHHANQKLDDDWWFCAATRLCGTEQWFSLGWSLESVFLVPRPQLPACQAKKTSSLRLVAPGFRRWKSDLEYCKAVVQVFAERPVPDRCEEMSIRGSDDADVGLQRSRSTNALILALLEKAQQLGLHCRLQLRDFIEKELLPIVHCPHDVGDGDKSPNSSCNSSESATTRVRGRCSLMIRRSWGMTARAAAEMRAKIVSGSRLSARARSNGPRCSTDREDSVLLDSPLICSPHRRRRA